MNKYLSQKLKLKVYTRYGVFSLNQIIEEWKKLKQLKEVMLKTYYSFLIEPKNE